MTSKYRVGQRVRWRWGRGWGGGVVRERFTSRVTRSIKGVRITRNATPDEPAYLVNQDDGARVLKSQSELSRAPR